MVRAFGRAVALIVTFGLIGHFARGRAVGAGFLLYLPLVPLGVMASLAGAMTMRLGQRKEGASILGIAITATIVGCWWMIGRGPAAAGDGGSPREVVRVLHWNVLWGWSRGGWESIIETIVARSPDIVIQSEAAAEPMRRRLLERLGEGWTETTIGSIPATARDYHHLVVASRWPVRLASTPTIRNGMTAEVVIDHPSQPIRILVVDGKSQPMIPRTPLLEDVAGVCERSAESGRSSIDIVAGDFNCVGRSAGFERLTVAGPGYAMASRLSKGWRGTWPSWFPVYDIDHVWVRNGIAIRSCSLFSAYASDHRGQIVELGLPHR